jgi:sugar lactone lactonase YvrE
VISHDADLLLDLRAEIGEGPLWDHRAGRLVFIDVVAGELFSATLGGSVEVSGIGHAVGAVGLRAAGGYVLATQEGVSTLEPGSPPAPFSELRLERGLRMNDAQVGPDGCLWAGSMAWDEAPGKGTLYRVRPDGGWSVVLESLSISNGIGWNAAADTMVYVDSPTHVLEAFDWSADGTISGRRVLAEVPEGYPDGLCVDDEDHVWLAVYGAGVVVRFAPSGERVATVRVPATNPTSCCFAGDNLDVLVITSAGQGLTPLERHDQHAGAVFAADVGVRGRRARLFGESD